MTQTMGGGMGPPRKPYSPPRRYAGPSKSSRTITRVTQSFRAPASRSSFAPPSARESRENRASGGGGRAPAKVPGLTSGAGLRISAHGVDSMFGQHGADYAAAMTQAFQHASSLLDASYLPGQITLQELPTLEHYFPGATQSLGEWGYTLTPQGYMLDKAALQTTLTGAGGGGGGGAPAVAPPITVPEMKYDLYKWKVGKYEAVGGNAPAWWRPMTPDRVTERSSYAMMMNAMIPYMSPEDQVRAAHSLYVFDQEGFSRYKPGAIPEARTLSEDEWLYRQQKGLPLESSATRREFVMDDSLKNYLMSSQRASDAVKTLSNMRQATVKGNRWKLGPGYVWLQSVLGSQSGQMAQAPEGGSTRKDYLSYLGSVDPFLSQASSGDLAAYGALGQMLATPFASSGLLVPSQQVNGRRVFGIPNLQFM